MNGETELLTLVLESKKLLREKNSLFLTRPRQTDKPTHVSSTKSQASPSRSEEKKIAPQAHAPKQEIHSHLPREDAHASMKHLIKSCAPHLAFREPLPPIVILAYEPEREFLENLAKAISQHIAPASVVESDKDNWKTFLTCSTLKCLIGPPSFIGKEDSPVHEPFFLKPSCLFFPLAHISQYQNNQNLKRDLWMRLKSLSL